MIWTLVFRYSKEPHLFLTSRSKPIPEEGEVYQSNQFGNSISTFSLMLLFGLLTGMQAPPLHSVLISTISSMCPEPRNGCGIPDKSNPMEEKHISQHNWYPSLKPWTELKGKVWGVRQDSVFNTRSSESSLCLTAAFTLFPFTVISWILYTINLPSSSTTLVTSQSRFLISSFACRDILPSA